MSDLVKKAIRNPDQIPPYVLGRMFPNSRWSSNWRRDDGFITFEDGGFAGGSPSRPELSARIYYEVSALESMLNGARFRRSLELGCGYGRLSGWIAKYADESVGIEPNSEALSQARTMYPEIDFYETLAGNLPFPDDHFDFLASWMVLTHVPPDSIEVTIDELERVLDDHGTILLCERTDGETPSASWPRSASTYDQLFKSYDLIGTTSGVGEPTFSYAKYRELMHFEGIPTTDDHESKPVKSTD